MSEQNYVMVSFVVAAYNTEKYIERCLRTIEQQDIDDYEIIVVDDCSKDSTYEAITRFSEKNTHVKLYQNEVNCGAGYTKNKAVSLCHGKYICFVDSDDWLVEGAIKQVYQLAETMQCDDVYYEMQSINEGSGSVPICDIEPHVKDVYDNGELFFEKMLDEHKVTVGAGHHFIRRDVISKGVRFSEGTVNDDWEFSTGLYRNTNRIIILSNPYYVYFRRKSESITNIANEVSLVSEIYRYISAICNDNLELRKISNRVKSKIILYRMTELQNEILLEKKGCKEELAVVMGQLANDPLQKELFEKSKRLSVYGIVDPRVLEQAKRASEVYIYGAGAYGRDSYRILTLSGIAVKSFVTTAGDGDYELGIPIQSINDTQPDKDSFFLVAVSERYKTEVVKTIKQKTMCDYGYLVV